MEPLNCPLCGAEMLTRSLRQSHVHQCPEGHGVFLERAELGGLAENETDWHSHAGQHTAPVPRITADMEAPPAPTTPQARAWVETLFG